LPREIRATRPTSSMMPVNMGTILALST